MSAFDTGSGSLIGPPNILGLSPPVFLGVLSFTVVAALLLYSIYNDRNPTQEMSKDKISVVGGLIIIGSIFLPWVDIGFASLSLIQLSELASELGNDPVVFYSVGGIIIAGILGIFGPGTGEPVYSNITKVLSPLLIFLSISFFVQVLLREGGTLSMIGIGVYVAAVGGLLILLSIFIEEDKGQIEWVDDESLGEMFEGS